jgi:signal transduction histidine kinase
MFGAMNVLRDQLNFVIHEVYADNEAAVRDTRTAIGKILDLELAIMLPTYREDLEAQNARSERLATFGQLIGSIGHELRNPLGVMESSIYILEQHGGGDVKTAKHTTRLREQVQIANGIVSALLDMIRDKPLAREAVQVAVTIASVVSSLRIPPSVRLHTSGLEDLPAIVGDPVQVRQMFLNLVENALQAIDGDGEVHIAGSFDGRRVEIAVEDSGPGVDVETRRRLFEPLITTKASGIGLGLALVKRIAERHGGDVRYLPRGRGARFVVSLEAGGANA